MGPGIPLILGENKTKSQKEEKLEGQASIVKKEHRFAVASGPVKLN